MSLNKKNTYIEELFSIKNIDIHKILTILGIRIKFKSNKLMERKKWEQINDNILDLSSENTKLSNILNYYLDNIQNNSLKQNKKVIYTCITSSYDDLIQHDYVSSDYDYICFTDNEKLLKHTRIGIWQIKPLLFNKLDNTRNARWHKVNFNNCVSSYSESIWVDGNVNIKTKYLFELIKDTNSMMLIPKHYRNDCVYQECDYVLECHKDTKENVSAIKEFLKSKNMPTNYGLNETNIIYRNHSYKQLTTIMQDWFECIEKYSKRDQLSCSYALWKNNIKIENIAIPNARVDKENYTVGKHYRKKVTNKLQY